MKTIPLAAGIAAYSFPLGTPLRIAAPRYIDLAQTYLLAGRYFDGPVMIPQSAWNATIYDPTILVRPWTGSLEIQIQAYARRAAATIEVSALGWDGAAFTIPALNKAEWTDATLPNLGTGALTVADLEELEWQSTGNGAPATPADGVGMIQLTPVNEWMLYRLAFVVSTLGDPDASIRLCRVVQHGSSLDIVP